MSLEIVEVLLEQAQSFSTILSPYMKMRVLFQTTSSRSTASVAGKKHEHAPANHASEAGGGRPSSENRPVRCAAYPCSISFWVRPSAFLLHLETFDFVVTRTHQPISCKITIWRRETYSPDTIDLNVHCLVFTSSRPVTHRSAHRCGTNYCLTHTSVTERSSLTYDMVQRATVRATLRSIHNSLTPSHPTMPTIRRTLAQDQGKPRKAVHEPVVESVRQRSYERSAS